MEIKRKGSSPKEPPIKKYDAIKKEKTGIKLKELLPHLNVLYVNLYDQDFDRWIIGYKVNHDETKSKYGDRDIGIIRTNGNGRLEIFLEEIK